MESCSYSKCTVKLYSQLSNFLIVDRLVYIMIANFIKKYKWRTNGDNL